MLVTDVQTTFNTLVLIRCPAHATRLRRSLLIHFAHLDPLDFRLVFKDTGKAVKRPAVQVKIAVPPPIFRFSVFVFTHAVQVTDVDAANRFLDTLFNDVLGETVEEMSAAVTPLRVESSRTLTTSVVTLGNFLGNVVPVLFQTVAGVQGGVVGAVGDGGKITDAKVDACGFLAGCFWWFDFVFADDV